jgi:hypothetical protein
MGIDIALGFAAALLGTAAAGEAVRPLNLSRPTAGHTYFNRPGADVSEHDRDLLRCIGHSSPVRSVDDEMGTGGILGQMITDSANRGIMAASLENCMVVHGWRVVRLDEAEGQALSRLAPPELRSKLAPWIGSVRPPGSVVRAWANDAANAAINHFALRPGHTKKGQLGLLVLAAGSSPAPEQSPAAPGDPEKPKIDPKWPKGPLKPAELAAAPAGAGIVIVAIRGMGLTRGNGFVFRRIGPSPDVRAAAADHGPDRFEALGGPLTGARTLAFALPPGRWRIGSEINGLMELNYCLGSPAFELKAGEVVYAGNLDLKSSSLRPDLSIDRIRQWLAGTPAAEAVKPAAWTNGSRGPCGPNSIYALEFDGAPFEPGYSLGSRAPRGRADAP